MSTPPAGRCCPATSSAPSGYQHHPDPHDRRNQCYCHGERHDPPRPPLDDDRARAAGVDYAYVIDPDRLSVLINLHGWQPVAKPAWTDSPDWDAIDRHAQQLRRWGPR